MIDVLEQLGFEVTSERRRSYRGSTQPESQIVNVNRGQFAGVALKTAAEDHYRQLQRLQDQIPHISKIELITGGLVVMEKAPGTLLWEIDDVLPDFDCIETCLQEFLSALAALQLVHADIRPWNLFYHQETNQFRFIDWGYSFFLRQPKPNGNTDNHLQGCGHHGRQERDVDRVDVQRMRQLLRSEIGLAAAWNYRPDTFSWRPRWCRP